MLFLVLTKDVWTELSGVLGKKDLARRRKYTCSVYGHDLTNMSVAVTKTEYVDCLKDRKLCKSKSFHGIL